MKLAKTIRFDPSDLNVFPLAADEGEWALVGTFCFAGIGEADIKDKVKQAFSNGFLAWSSIFICNSSFDGNITTDCRYI